MAHKVHPKVYRIKKIEDWESRWFAKGRDFAKFLEEDFKIREFLENKLKDCAVSNIEIERFPGKVNIIVNTARPGLIIGRGGQGVENLKKEIEKLISKDKKEKKEIRLEIREVKEFWKNASLVAQWVAQQIEKRLPHRRVMKQAIEKVSTSPDIKGVRIEVAGRLGGAEIARREWLQKGRLPRQTIRAIIDYSHKEAFCSYGVIGVKVWIYKGEEQD